MKRVVGALLALGGLTGLTGCGGHASTHAIGGEASCTDLLHRGGQTYGTWFLKSNDIHLVGHRYIAVFKDCADTGGTPRPDQEVAIRRIAGVPLSQGFYVEDPLHWNTIYVAGGEIPAEQWRQLPPKVRPLVKHP